MNHNAVRPTPYDIVFGPEVFEAKIFPAIQSDWDAGSAATDATGAFLTRTAVTEVLADLLPDADPDPQATRSTGLFLYHAFHYWLTGKQQVDVTSDELERLLAADGTPETTLVPPAAAGYAQLPRNAFWAQTAGDVPAEPIDGFFWTRLGSVPGDMPLDLLFVLGVRSGRGGVSLIEVHARDPEGEWTKEVARADPEDFANILPGGELQNYRGVRTTRAALRLAGLVFGAMKGGG